MSSVQNKRQCLRLRQLGTERNHVTGKDTHLNLEPRLRNKFREVAPRCVVAKAVLS